jgi:hypothetical protein
VRPSEKESTDENSFGPVRRSGRRFDGPRGGAWDTPDKRCYQRRATTSSVVSARSQRSSTFESDLAVGLNAGDLPSGRAVGTFGTATEVRSLHCYPS